MWEPKQGWSEPVDNLWHTVGLDDETTGQQLADVVAILGAEQASDTWRLDSHDAIPLVWVAPPNWPSAPAGWSPPDRWKPPRQWGRAPRDWQFWQHDPTIIAHKAAAIHAVADQRSRALVRSTAGIATVLSLAEVLVCNAARLTPLSLSPLPSAVRHGFPLTAPRDLEESLKSAHRRLIWQVSNLRTYLLRIAYGLGQVDDWLWQLRRALVDEREAYQLAAKSAAEGVFHSTVKRIEREISRTNPRQAQRRAHLLAVLGELSDDIQTRASALRPQRNSNATDESEHLPGVSDWEVAEDLAAEHLRSLGFSDALRTPVGSDGGFDVEGRGIVAQVKYRATAVGRPDVQRLVGANQHRARSAFFARAGYTKSATEYAQQTGVALFVLDAATSQVEPANEAAVELSARAR